MKYFGVVLFCIATQLLLAADEQGVSLAPLKQGAFIRISCGPLLALTSYKDDPHAPTYIIYRLAGAPHNGSVPTSEAKTYIDSTATEIKVREEADNANFVGAATFIMNQKLYDEVSKCVPAPTSPSK